MSDDVVVKSYEFLIAVATLVGTLIVSATTLWQQRRNGRALEKTVIAIRDTGDVRAAFRKPLEGVWKYKLEWETYFDGKAQVVSQGIAIILWRPDEKHYEILISYSVFRHFGKNSIVTGFVRGQISADTSGWPPPQFDIPMEYVHRTGTEDATTASGPGFSFRRSRCVRSQDKERVMTILTEYDEPKGKGAAELHFQR